MLRTALLFLLCAAFSAEAYAQEFEAENTYRSPDNPHYWANDKPYSDYWQQDVHYQIRATIDDSAEAIKANYYKLTYWNNSPDTLRKLYFHLYQNAFKEGSYYHVLKKENGKTPDFNPEGKAIPGRGTDCRNIKVNGQSVEAVVDNTIMEVSLNEPLMPDDKLEVTMEFTTYWNQSSLRSRSKVLENWGYKHFDGVHWYPIIAMYDHKFKWTTEQHLDKEFYANFGTFDVALTFPKEYIVGATGTLQNRQEVMPESLRKKLDLENFKDKPMNSEPSEIIPAGTGETKTWIYHAENVHNFAFTADPTYRIDEVEWNGIRAVALAREPHAAGWQPSAEFAMRIIKLYSKDIGQYAWPKIIVADADDGMEYPMLTLDGGTYPGHQGLIAHEVGHMWYYGMLGTNEHYRAIMDEGFTQFLTAWSMEKLTNYNTGPLDTIPIKRYGSAYYAYLRYVHDGHDHKLNTHSSDFNTALRHGGGYSHVYVKMATALYNLQYVLGDELFLEAMQYYFDNWKMKHPYPEDFRKAISDYVQTDLTWFFDQWLTTTKEIDYAIQGVSKGQEAGSYNIHFKRKGRMEMPLDFTVITQSGDSVRYHIPNKWFVKKTDAKVLPKWYGWGKAMNSEHTATVSPGGKIKKVVIDPTHRLADVDMKDNEWNRTKAWTGIPANTKLKLHPPKSEFTDWENYRMYWNPDIWYNHFDGLQAGATIRGNYFKQDNKFRLTGWFNTGELQGDAIGEGLEDEHQAFAVSAENEVSMRSIWKNLSFAQRFDYNAGLWRGQLELKKEFFYRDYRNKQNHTSAYLRTNYMRRETASDAAYLLYPEFWSVGQKNNYVEMGFDHMYRYFGNDRGHIKMNFRTPGIWSDLNYSFADLELLNTTKFGKFELHTRGYGRVGYGALSGQVPESALYLAGASPEQYYDNRFLRARGFVPEDWLGFGPSTNHFHYGGGLNLRAYSGFAATTINDLGLPGQNFRGKSGLSANIELDFDNYLDFIKFKGSRKWATFDTYLFGDIGSMTYVKTNQDQAIGDLKMDAGAGIAMNWKWGGYNLRPITLRFDWAPYMNRSPASEDDFEAERFVVGLRRAF